MYLIPIVIKICAFVISTGVPRGRSGEIYSKQISRLRFAALEMTHTSTLTIYNWYYIFFISFLIFALR